MKTRVLVATATVLLAGGVAAGCSSSSTSGSASSGSPAPTTSAPATGGTGSSSLVLTTHTVSGVGTVIDANGRTVYFDDQDTTGKILCTGTCATVWVPVTTTSTPAAIDGVTFGTVARPGGTMQLTADGHPLYTFALDSSASQATGQGKHDSFAGQSFSWHALTTTKAGTSGGGGAGTPSAPPSTPSPTGPSGGYGGY
jgi:predicted lipoprotein with Yx(FWY)xxD motif